MALSNWDTLGIDQDGNSCFGINGLKKNRSVEIYKNWLYVHDKDMWVERSYSKPVIAEISSGTLKLSDFDIVAERGPQSAVFCFITLIDYKAKKRRWFGGIGCYGFDDDTERLAKAMGIDLNRYELFCTTQEEPKDYLEGGYHFGKPCEITERMFVQECIDKTLPEGSGFVEFKMPYRLYNELGSKYVGIMPETYQAFLGFLDEQREDMSEEQEEWLDKLISGEIKSGRFNQGDQFFKDNGVLGNTPTTLVGDTPEEPIIMSILGKE